MLKTLVLSLILLTIIPFSALGHGGQNMLPPTDIVWWRSLNITWKDFFVKYAINKGLSQNRSDTSSIITSVQNITLLDSLPQVEDLKPLARLQKLTKITSLRNGLPTINDISALFVLKELRGIAIRNQKIVSIEGIKVCKNLNRLDLSGNMIHSIAPGELPASLKMLDLSYNPLVLFTFLGNLHKITELRLAATGFERFNDIPRSNSIRYLDISFSKLKSLSGISRIKKIHSLKMVADLCPEGGYTIINHKIPDWKPMKALTHLKALDISCHKNDTINISFLYGLKDLDTLILSWNTIKGGIEPLIALSALSYLNLDAVRILKPKAAEYSDSLKYNIYNIPETVSKLKSLKFLSWQTGNIVSTQKISGLTLLTYLDLSNSFILDLNGIEKMPSLHTFKCNDCVYLNDISAVFKNQALSGGTVCLERVKINEEQKKELQKASFHCNDK